MSSTSPHSLGLLVLRVSFATMMLFAHGLPKLLGFVDKAGGFPDPLGVGHTPSLVLAIVGEVVCTAMLAVGWYARPAALGSAVTMAVAALLVHASDPFATKELALVYGVGFAALALLGPGRLSLDARRGRA